MNKHVHPLAVKGDWTHLKSSKGYTHHNETDTRSDPNLVVKIDADDRRETNTKHRPDTDDKNVVTATPESLIDTIKSGPLQLLPRDYFASIKQRTPDWDRLRGKFVLSSSEFSSALGVGYKTRKELHLQKVGKWAPSEYSLKMMQQGALLEPKAFDAFKKLVSGGLLAPRLTPTSRVSETGTWMFGDGLVSDPYVDITPLFCATPDGLLYDADGSLVAVLEIKCPYAGGIYKDVLLDRVVIKQGHFVQVQAQMAATGTRCAYYVCYSYPRLAVVRVAYNEEFVKWMFNELVSFSAAHLPTHDWFHNREDGGWITTPQRFKPGERKTRVAIISKYAAETETTLLINYELPYICCCFISFLSISVSLVFLIAGEGIQTPTRNVIKFVKNSVLVRGKPPANPITAITNATIDTTTDTAKFQHLYVQHQVGLHLFSI